MARNRIITYAIERTSGLVISRVDNEVAWPILDYEAIGQNGDFTGPTRYNLEKISVHSIPAHEWRNLEWTKKIPVRLKNLHRAFWGMPTLKALDVPTPDLSSPEAFADWCAGLRLAERRIFWAEMGSPEGVSYCLRQSWATRHGYPHVREMLAEPARFHTFAL